MFKPIGKHGANSLFFLLADTPHGVLEALATTTLSAAVAVNDTSIVVASATSVAAGRFVRIDGETMQVAKNYLSGTTVPVQRGVDGTVTAAHPVTANVTHGSATDFAAPPAGVQNAVTNPPLLATDTKSYTAAGAIGFGAAQINTAIINGTNALAMTLADPTKDQDGMILIVVGNGKAAHTVTYTAGLGNAGSNYDVGTFDTLGQCSMMFIAANGIWVPLPSPLSGTLTSIDVAIA